MHEAGKNEVLSLFPDKFCVEFTETAHHVKIYERIAKSDKIFGLPRELWNSKVIEMNNESFSIQVMNGERLHIGCDTYLYGVHLLRLRVDAKLIKIPVSH